MEESIQFIANYTGWQSVRKIKITEQTGPLRIIEFLSTLTYNIDSKVEDNLKKIGDLSKIDAFLDENVDEGKGEAEIIKSYLNKHEWELRLTEQKRYCGVES